MLYEKCSNNEDEEDDDDDDVIAHIPSPSFTSSSSSLWVSLYGVYIIS